ncbi:UBA/THIF-type NAD/FAD binding family protein [Desulforapulum autotrophicum HRM2]|uniref:UBA/THIF-type NAD/FAD binding family protein n=1 Tax=Desulforapulum autotrophicum (strain ATCC 43914 / DSM 3382 / VKM B-1955 / HRM2) TaxID=177437 RepID=C0QGD8_DESAH|nr:ThiF family adenylyltransferase [Desulforapulum autotrophicum]ACN17717.1 UBA/THIF-type NAD/FAD binding family protein [Desulforapulum autotrophicum HRM2]
MPIKSYLEKLQEYGISSQKEYHIEAFSRNIGLLTPEEQEILAKSKIAIPGMGGVGSAHLITMVRTGIGRFNIADFDIYEPANVNRQFGARVPDFGRPKLDVMKEQALSINPFLEITEFPDGINAENMDLFLDGVSVVIDSLDFFAFDIRRQLFNRAREKGIYVITAGPLGFGSAMLVFAPDRGIAFDDYFNIIEDMKPEDQYLAFAMGLAPKALQFKYMDTSKLSFKSRKGPSLNIACQLCTGMAGTEAVRIILGKGMIKPVPYYSQFDPYLRKYCIKKLNMGNKHPWQRIKTVLVKKMLTRNTPIGPEEPEKPVSLCRDGKISGELLDYIIKAGIQAPSGDNVQPWKFAKTNNRITLYLDKAADESFFNVHQMASVISCGAVIENMKITATGFGLKADLSYGEGDTMAQVDLSINDAVEKDLLADYIWKRKTNRKLFEKRKASQGLLVELRDSIQNIQGTGIHFITDTDSLEKLARVVSKADRIRTERQDLHEHFFKMIRFSPEETLDKRDGFYIKNLEAGVDGEAFLRTTRSWPVMNIANKLGFGKIVAKAAYDALIHSSGAALVVVRGINTESYLNGGRALERVWLTLSRYGFELQPMTAITLFLLRKQLDGDGAFDSKHRKLLNEIRGEYGALFPDCDFTQDGQVMLFRFGKASQIKYQTLRKYNSHFAPMGKCVLN